MSPAHLQSLARARILVIGDVMLDHFVWGNVRRISPEAPVPVVEVSRETWFPGGAANVARNIAPFSKHSFILGRVGNDEAAAKLGELLVDEGVNIDPMLVHQRLPTISKMRIAARQQQIVRVDREIIENLGSDELIEIEKRVSQMLPNLDAIVLEDYGKGFITQALIDTIVPLANQAGKLITADPNPRNPLNWHGVSLIKPNRLEAFAAAGIEDRHRPGNPTQDPDLLRVGSILLEKWSVPHVLITLGEQGMILFNSSTPSQPHHIPTRAREVFDVSGAGDTAIALLTLALAADMSIEEAAEIANHASGIVVGKLGTATLTPEELLASFATDA